MTIRNFRGSDIEKIPQIWQKDMPFITVSREYFIRKIVLEDNFLPEGFFAAEDDSTGEILGFVCAVYRRTPICAGIPVETDRGWISAFCVPDRSRCDEIGGALLSAAEDYLFRNGKTQLSTGFFPQYFTQGIEENLCPEYASLFGKHGWNGSRSWSLSMPLNGYSTSGDIRAKRNILENEGIYTGALRDDLLLSLLDPNAPFSNASWSYEFKMRLAELDFGCIRVAALGGKVIGAAACNDRTAPCGRFGPFGVDPSMRGKGIGSVLLDDALCEMKRRGYETAWMQWVGDSGSAYHLYTKAGFTKNNTYLTFTKSL